MYHDIINSYTINCGSEKIMPTSFFSISFFGIAMSVFHIFVINRAGSLIYSVDNTSRYTEVEKTFSFPLSLKLQESNHRVAIEFGSYDNIRSGHVLVAINGDVLDGTKLNGHSALDFLSDSSNYPCSLKFARPALASNEKIILSSTFHSLFAIGSQLSPESTSSGIEVLEADTFRLQCFQTRAGNKFVVIADPHISTQSLDPFLRKLYELYSDYALKNPFYSLEQPIRCELFDQAVRSLVDRFDKSNNTI